MLFPLTASAQIIHETADQPTIQMGIDSASNGDTVLVADGIYNENIRVRGNVGVGVEVILNYEFRVLSFEFLTTSVRLNRSYSSV